MSDLFLLVCEHTKINELSFKVIERERKKERRKERDSDNGQFVYYNAVFHLWSRLRPHIVFVFLFNVTLFVSIAVARTVITSLRTWLWNLNGIGFEIRALSYVAVTDNTICEYACFGGATKTINEHLIHMFCSISPYKFTNNFFLSYINHLRWIGSVKFYSTNRNFPFF